MSMNPGARIVLVGNIAEGLRFFGPFSTSEDAISWAELAVCDQWTVVSLESEEDL